MPKIGRPRAEVVVTDAERATLVRLTKRARVNRAVAFRARIVLACIADSDTAVARRLRTTKTTVAKWRSQFVERRLEGLYDEPRVGAPRTISDEQVEAIIVTTLETTPPGETHWSTRSMAKAAGVSHTMVGRIWRTFRLQPHRTESFKLSPDPQLVEKIRDVVGLYVAPPANAVVFAVDEKSQIQALQRAQPILPMDFGQPERRTHNYLRHGTLDLFAALNVATGEVIARCKPQHRAQDFVAFLREVESTVEPTLDIHVVLDNLSAHRAPPVQRWLLRHPRVHFHFTPTYASWLNLVERFFGLLTEKALKRGSHTSIAQLRAAILAYVDAHNDRGTLFTWVKPADEILDSMRRFGLRVQQCTVNDSTYPRNHGSRGQPTAPSAPAGRRGRACPRRSAQLPHRFER
jgi:transposase